jgi:hypothetical protein
MSLIKPFFATWREKASAAGGAKQSFFQRRCSARLAFQRKGHWRRRGRVLSILLVEDFLRFQPSVFRTPKTKARTRRNP